MSESLTQIDTEVRAAIERRSAGLLTSSRTIFDLRSDPAELVDGGFSTAWPEDRRTGMDGSNGVTWSGRLVVTLATPIGDDQHEALRQRGIRETWVQDALMIGPDDACPVESATSLEPVSRRRVKLSRWLLTEYTFTVTWTETIRAAA